MKRIKYGLWNSVLETFETEIKFPGRITRVGFPTVVEALEAVDGQYAGRRVRVRRFEANDDE